MTVDAEETVVNEETIEPVETVETEDCGGCGDCGRSEKVSLTH